jgi:hypothetical protein
LAFRTTIRIAPSFHTRGVIANRFMDGHPSSWLSPLFLWLGFCLSFRSSFQCGFEFSVLRTIPPLR